MTNYRTPYDELTIPFGPGAVNLGTVDGWFSADVALKLEYENAAPGATRAVLELVAEQVDKNSGSDEVHIQVELTHGDLARLFGTITAIETAIQEDA